jgi:hypothetical protein
MCQFTFERLGARCLASALAVILCSCSSASPVAPTPISAIDVASMPSTVSATTSSHSPMAGAVPVSTAEDATAVPQSLRTAISANAITAADAPAAPTSLRSRVSGKTVALTWSYAPLINRTDAAFVIQVGSAPGQSDLLSTSISTLFTTFTQPNVPKGTYYVRVYAAIGREFSAPSNEAVVDICPKPGPPTNFSVQTITDSVGTKATLVWTAPAGVDPYDYVVIVSGSLPTGEPGTFNIPNPSYGRYELGYLPAGRYAVRLQAETCGGRGAATPDYEFTIQSTARQYDGSYAGSFSGDFAGPVDGRVAFTVNNGDILVSAPGPGSGSVSGSGSATFSGSGTSQGVACQFSGGFRLSGSAASAGGNWSCTNGRQRGAGTWTAARR